MRGNSRAPSAVTQALNGVAELARDGQGFAYGAALSRWGEGMMIEVGDRVLFLKDRRRYRVTKELRPGYFRIEGPPAPGRKLPTVLEVREGELARWLE